MSYLDRVRNMTPEEKAKLEERLIADGTLPWARALTDLLPADELYRLVRLPQDEARAELARLLREHAH